MRPVFFSLSLSLPPAYPQSARGGLRRSARLCSSSSSSREGGGGGGGGGGAAAAAEKQEEEEMETFGKENMKRLKKFLIEKCEVPEHESDKLCKFCIEIKPTQAHFIDVVARSIHMMYQSGVDAVLNANAASRFVFKAVSEDGRLFSRLSITESSGYGPGSGSGSGSMVPLTYQDKGKEALRSPLQNECFPAPGSNRLAEDLWPLHEWDKVISEQMTRPERKFNILLKKQSERLMPQQVKSVFIKGFKGICDTKIPDFFLVNKHRQDTPTPDSVGALLFLQSTSDTSSYSVDSAVGEAIACGQILLRNSSSKRNFVW